MKNQPSIIKQPENENGLPQVVNVQSALLEIVTRKDIDPERLEKFLDIQVKMEARQAQIEFQAAMARFQNDCPIIVKNKKVNFPSKSGKTTKYDYAPLDEIVHKIKPILARHGLSFTFDINPTSDSLHELLTTVGHSGGHSKDFKSYFNPIHDDTRMNGAQRRKSALSYAKRAGLENALGIVTAGDDDDAIRTKADEKAMFGNKTKESYEPLIRAFMGIGISQNDITFLLSIENISDLNQEHVEHLRTVYKEIKDGEKTKEEVFKEVL